MGRRRALLGMVVGVAFQFGCGSTESTQGGARDAGTDGALLDGALFDATSEASPGDASVDASSDAQACLWTPYDDGLTGAQIQSVAFDKRAPSSVVYARSKRGTFAGGTIAFLAMPGTDPTLLLATSSAGVIRSTDSGQTWSPLSLSGEGLSAIAAASLDANRVYVSLFGGGVLRSDDGGATWTAVDFGYPIADTFALDVAPDNADEVVAGVQIFADGGSMLQGAMLRTTNAGQTWATAASTSDVWNVRRCPASPAVLYAGTSSGLQKSSDRGATWQAQPGSTAVIIDIGVSSTDCNAIDAFVQSTGPEASTDGGQTFGPPLTQGLGLDLIDGQLVVDPANASTLLLGNHTGVWSSSNAGALWSQATGLLGLQVRALNVSPLDPTRTWLGTWGSGAWQRASSATPWQRVPTTVLPADYVFAVAADPDTAHRVLMGTWPTLYESTDDGTTFTSTGLSQNQFAFGFDPTNASVLYTTTQLNGVYKSIDAGMTWVPSNTGLTPWVGALGTPAIDTRSIAVDPAAPLTLYIGTEGRGVYASTDGAQSWTNVLAPTANVECVLAVAGPPTSVYACVDGSGVEKSIDGGQTWTNVNLGLPTDDINGLAVDPVSGALIATTTSGTYTKTGTANWQALDTTCLPGVVANAPAVVSLGADAGSAVIVGAAGSVYAHPL
jgi:photosystem II stability/assembly factor-like uncharacterized protein